MKAANAWACVAAACLPSALAVGTNDQVEPNIDYGSFQTPSAAVRPRFRYWPNDASHDLSRVAEDVRLVGQAGAGGLELLGYYLYGDSGYGGGNTAPLQSDWTIYGFGLPAWKDLQDTVLQTAQEENLIIDLAIGPDQGAGVPAPYDDEGLLWDLVMFNTTIAAGSSFANTLPGWGTGPLVAATTAMITNISISEVAATFDSVASTVSKITLDASSLADITSQVDGGGMVNVTFPTGDSNDKYQVFAFYLIPSHFREVVSPTDVASTAAVPQSPVTEWQQNGSLVVDHFSSRGAQTIINFWEEYLLTGNTKDILAQVGNYMWEDSQEYAQGVSILWTPDFQQAFEKNRGYSINKYLPILQTAGFGSLSIPATYELDGPAGEESYIQAYEQTLTELNEIYLSALTNWSTSLGLQFSAQVAYNIDMDMEQNIPYVNAPETETLGFGHNIDGYRQYAGPANLAGKRVVSSEAGANFGLVYQQTIPYLLWDLKRSLVGGINNFILHGWPFSGNYGNTTWPGFTTFAYQFSEMHGPRQPAFEFYPDWMDFVSRCQFIGQTGIPKVDLVFWHKQLSSSSGATVYYPDDLRSAGFTYEYISPDNFDLPNAVVSNKVFAPDRQAFSAMIIRGNETLTVTGVNKLVDYAQQGLPIVFSGGLPSNVTGESPDQASPTVATLSKITSLSNVHMCGYDDLASTLASIQIIPRTEITTNGTWYTRWRHDDSASTSYVLVYNDNANGAALNQPISNGNLSVALTGTPYLYDAWTGAVTPISSYSQTSGRTTVYLELAVNQLVIIGFKTGEAADVHVTDLGVKTDTTMGNGGKGLAQKTIYSANSQSCTLSSGKSVPISPMLAEPFSISNWTLIVESWTAPANLFDVVDGPTKTNTTYNMPELTPWANFTDALVNVSGLGYYSASFTWPPAEEASGAYIDFGSIVHTARVSINGQQLPPLDLSWAKADIGSLLVNGTNNVNVVVSTTLGNALIPIWGELESSGKKTVQGSSPAAAPFSSIYGLVGEVKVVPYRVDMVG